jgi:radical SAM superfamily enzyme YgiQ (UPF0313 family)
MDFMPQPTKTFFVCWELTPSLVGNSKGRFASSHSTCRNISFPKTREMLKRRQSSHLIGSDFLCLFARGCRPYSVRSPAHASGETRLVGYTEASRACKHLCRHCPGVPVQGGRFRVISRDVVLDDIAQQVNAGAQHITFGDPDFFKAQATLFAL